MSPGADLQQGFRSFVEPRNPALELLFPVSGGSREDALDRAVEGVRERLRYRAVRGRRSLDDIHEELRSRPEAAPEVNCLSLCAVLVSQLRKEGFGADEVFVVVGGLRGVAQFHAWVAVRSASGHFHWIDPADPSCEDRLPGERILRLHTIQTVFNDRHLYTTRREIERLLLGRTDPGKLRLIGFGNHDPEMATLLNEPALHEVVSQLFRERVPAERLSAALLQRALDARLVRSGAGNTVEPGTALVLVPTSASRDLLARTSRHLDAYAGSLQASLPTLQDTFTRTAPARRFRFSEVIHALAAGALMDLAVGRHLASRGEGLQHGTEPVVWAFEGTETENPYGVQRAMDSSGGHVLAQLWHRRVPRSGLRVSPRGVRALVRIAHGEEPDLNPKETLYLRHLGLLAGHGGRGFEVTFPIFDGEDWKRLGETLDRVAEQLVETAVLPALQELEDTSWWGERIGDVPHRHAAFRLLLEGAIDRAIALRVLPAFPDEGQAPRGWGRWLWSGNGTGGKQDEQ